MKLSIIFISLFIATSSSRLAGQCFSSANPIGGTANLLTLEKNSMRIIPYYKYRYSDKYFEGHKKTTATAYKDANYNYAGAITGYGIIPRITVEWETGYFINKTMRTKSGIDFTGRGFSNNVISGKFGLVQNNDKRIYYSISAGYKFPFSKKAKIANGAVLNEDLQPSTRALGVVFQSFLVKESSFTGYRFFLINRFEINGKNPDGYQVGYSSLNSLYLSKHIMKQIVGLDLTFILQLRNEIRDYNMDNEQRVTASGGYLFMLVPQVNLTLKKKYNLSLLSDIPVYQYFNETQLANKLAIGVNLVVDLSLTKN